LKIFLSTFQRTMSRTFWSDTKFCQKIFRLIYSLKIFSFKCRIGHKIDIRGLSHHGQISRVYETWQKYLCRLMYGLCQNMFFVGDFCNLTIYLNFFFFVGFGFFDYFRDEFLEGLSVTLRIFENIREEKFIHINLRTVILSLKNLSKWGFSLNIYLDK